MLVAVVFSPISGPIHQTNPISCFAVICISRCQSVSGCGRVFHCPAVSPMYLVLYFAGVRNTQHAWIGGDQLEALNWAPGGEGARTN